MNMSDRERILMNIAVDTSGSICDTFEHVHGWKIRMCVGRPAPQFIATEFADRMEMPMKLGDIVRCETNPNHAWGISELVEIINSNTFILKQIGNDKLMRMTNESLYVLRFMRPHRLYSWIQHKIYNWAKKAFWHRYNPAADRYKCFGGAEFGDGNHTIYIWSRAHIFTMERERDGMTEYAQPRRFFVYWNKKTRLKDIVDAMISQGFEEEFDYGPDKPTEGQEGYVSFTKASPKSVLNTTG